jgi:C4-dicarboxylate-specific signal transduction histidine kinase
MSSEERSDLFLLGRLAASIAHDGLNSATVVAFNLRGVYQMLATAISEELWKEIEPRLALALEASEHTRALLMCVRNGARPSGVTAIDMSDPVHAALRLTRMTTDNRAHVIDRVSAGMVIADRAQMICLCANLIVNAAEAIEPGKKADNRIRVNGAIVDGYYVLDVEDTGHGISDADLLRARAGSTPGFGLASVRDIVASVGGVFALERLPRGSRARVQLPTASAARAELSQRQMMR